MKKEMTPITDTKLIELSSLLHAGAVFISALGTDNLNSMIEEIKASREMAKFYANRENWQRIEGHTAWASNLKEVDCALLNCGGGRARIHLKKFGGAHE